MMKSVVLISGNGSNLQAVIDNINGTAKTNDETPQNLPIKIVSVISNNPDAYGLERAKKAGIHTDVLNHRKFNSREDFDHALQKLIDQYNPELLILAGFMRILSDDFVNHYLGRMINIHPSLLPQFPGLNTHQQALDLGLDIHGASVHFVTPELDSGPVIIQAQVPIKTGDTVDDLKARVLEQEHIIYPIAIRWFAQHRLYLKDNMAYLDNCPLAP